MVRTPSHAPVLFLYLVATPGEEVGLGEPCSGPRSPNYN